MRAVIAVSASLLILGAASGRSAGAQGPDTHQIRRAVAANVAEWAPMLPQFAGKQLILDRRPVGFWYDQRLHMESGSQPIPATEAVDLAAAMRGRVAADDDQYKCRAASAQSSCVVGPSNVTLVRIGEPRIAGDSAIVTVNVSTITAVRGRNRPSATIYAVWVTRRSGTNWVVSGRKEVGGG